MSNSFSQESGQSFLSTLQSVLYGTTERYFSTGKEEIVHSSCYGTINEVNYDWGNFCVQVWCNNEPSWDYVGWFMLKKKH